MIHGIHSTIFDFRFKQPSDERQYPVVATRWRNSNCTQSFRSSLLLMDTPAF